MIFYITCSDMAIIPVFKAGEVPRAADFSALVAAVRELMEAQGLARVVQWRCPRRVYFVTGGSCVALQGAEGQPVVTVSEWLWQCGGRVRLLPGGAAGGAEDVLDSELAADAGVHGRLGFVYHGEGMLFEVDVDSVAWDVARWVDEPAAEDGSVAPDAVHGEALVGCVSAVPGVLRQRQRAVQMWAQPQWASFVYREPPPVAGRPDLYGSALLLPSRRLEQVVGRAAGAYTGSDGVVVPVWHCWLGRLDVFGQLHFGARNIQ